MQRFQNRAECGALLTEVILHLPNALVFLGSSYRQGLKVLSQLSFEQPPGLRDKNRTHL